jgi:PAS domain S-box-containing protein
LTTPLREILSINRLHLTLFQKAFILVAVPLAFEIFLLGVVGWLLFESEREARQSDHAKAVLAKTSEVVQLLYDIGFAFVAYDAKTNAVSEKRLSETLAGSETELTALQDLVSNEPQHLKLVKQVASELAEALRLLKAQKKAIESGQNLDVMMAFEMRRSLNGMVSELDGLIKEERLSQEKNPQAANRLKLLLKLALGSGVVTSVLLAFILVTKFHQSTTRRLKVLMDNSVNLGAGKELRNLLDGDDEIAQIDRIFHLTAQELREAQAKERAIVDNAVDVICSINSVGKFSSVSPAAEKLWGYTTDEMIGRDWREVICESDLERSVEWANKIRKSATNSTLENRVRRKDGSLADMSWSAHWSPTELALFCVAHDISERLEMERFKQQFIAMISHDLRTPLTAVKSTLELLASGGLGTLTEKAQTKVLRAEDNLRHTIDLINDLLDLEKMESGKMELELKAVELSALLKRCAGAVASLAEKRSISLDMTACVVTVFADERRLSQTVINLLGNAIKFSPEGSKVTVRAENLSGEVRVTIQDQGPGIPAAKQALIFERYYQMSESGQAKQEGTGLGLTISKAIITAHNGRIGVDSEEGKGSTFWFCLPH